MISVAELIALPPEKVKAYIETLPEEDRITLRDAATDVLVQKIIDVLTEEEV